MYKILQPYLGKLRTVYDHRAELTSLGVLKSMSTFSIPVFIQLRELTHNKKPNKFRNFLMGHKEYSKKYTSQNNAQDKIHKRLYIGIFDCLDIKPLWFLMLYRRKRVTPLRKK